MCAARRNEEEPRDGTGASVRDRIWVEGAALGISEVTVRAHRGRVMQKMGADSLAELVTMAMRLELPLTSTMTPPIAAPRPRYTLTA